MAQAVRHPGLTIQHGVALPLRADGLVAPLHADGRGLGAAALAWVGTGFLVLLAACVFVAGLAAAYSLKRALNIDVVPGVDMLPDQEIEAAIRAVLALLGF